MVAGILEDKRRQILAIAAGHGARNVRLFGSAARGDATEASDLDFLVEMEKGRTLLDLVGLWQDLEELLGTRVDVPTEGGAEPLPARADPRRSGPPVKDDGVRSILEGLECGG